MCRLLVFIIRMDARLVHALPFCDQLTELCDAELSIARCVELTDMHLGTVDVGIAMPVTLVCLAALGAYLRYDRESALYDAVVAVVRI